MKSKRAQANAEVFDLVPAELHSKIIEADFPTKLLMVYKY